jgi:hypothetical protein
MNTLEINVFCRKGDEGPRCDFDVVRGRVSVPDGDAVRWHAADGDVTVTFPEGSPFAEEKIVIKTGQRVLTPLSPDAAHRPFMSHVACDDCPSTERSTGPQIIVES